MPILLGLLLAGCGGGYGDGPAIALPPGTALADAPPVDQRGAVVERQNMPMNPELWSGPATVQVPRPSDVPPEIADNRGPRGTSGEAHDDGVGYATLMAGPPEARWSNVAVGVGYAGLPPGTLVELTALDTGRTIVALVVGRENDGALVSLSPGAAQDLGVGDRAPVRVRSVVSNPQDEMALRSGRSASARLDAPPALLTALRRKLPGLRTAPRTTVAPRGRAPLPRAAAPAVAVGSGFIVQVAALSSAARAEALARDIGGYVARSGGLYRVQIGPFADSASATRARDGVARRGYGDARIFHTE